MCDQCGRGFRIKYDMVQHRLKTHFGVPPKRRKLHQKMGMTTTYIATNDGQIINEQVTTTDIYGKQSTVLTTNGIVTCK